MGLAIAQNFNSHNSDHVQIQSGHSTTLRVMTLNKCKSKGGGEETRMTIISSTHNREMGRGVLKHA